MAESAGVVGAEDATAGLVAGSQVQEPEDRVSVWDDIPLHVYKWTPNGDIK